MLGVGAFTAWRSCATAGIEPAPPMTPEQFGDYLRAEVAKWGKVVKAAGIKPESL